MRAAEILAPYPLNDLIDLHEPPAAMPRSAQLGPENAQPHALATSQATKSEPASTDTSQLLIQAVNQLDQVSISGEMP